MPTTLSQHPKTALNIIEFISTFNAVELTLYRALSLMLGDDSGRVAEAILSKIDSVAYKQSVVIDVAKLQPESSDVAKAVVAAEPTLKRAAKMRNDLAHGVYAQDNDSDLAILGNLFSFGKKPLKVEKVDRQAIINLGREVSAVTIAINKTFGGEGVSLHGGVVSGQMRTEHRDEDPSQPDDMPAPSSS